MKSKGNVVRQRLIAAVSRYARSTRKPVTIKQFCRVAKVRESEVSRHFPRGIRELLAAAGMPDRASRHGKVDFAALMAEIERVAGIVRRVPSPADMERVGRFSTQTYYERLGSWAQVRRDFEAWRKDGGPANREETPGEWTRSPDGPGTVGEQLCLPGMLLAPTCESAVIFLFGLIARQLGFIVEQVGTAFPDCRALEPIPDKENRWRRVAIEFEHKSSNFRIHGHDPKLCDLIICWDHDWKDCPVRVIELKSKIEELRAAKAA